MKQAVTFVSRYEERLAQAARDADCDGVICGHVHTPMATANGGFTYFNTGDWIEHRSALVEFDDGQMELVHLPNCSTDVARSMSAHCRVGRLTPESTNRTKFLELIQRTPVGVS